jgi:hypothetical protein
MYEIERLRELRKEAMSCAQAWGHGKCHGKNDTVPPPFGLCMYAHMRCASISSASTPKYFMLDPEAMMEMLTCGGGGEGGVLFEKCISKVINKSLYGRRHANLECT